jgi:hypothetical protein
MAAVAARHLPGRVGLGPAGFAGRYDFRPPGPMLANAGSAIPAVPDPR